MKEERGQAAPFLKDGCDGRQFGVSANRLALDEDLRNRSHRLPDQLAQSDSVNAGFDNVDILIVTMTLRF